MPRIAIMQGRLVTPKGPRPHFFPREQWRSEFALAAQAGLDAIEWIYDAYGSDVNPLGTDQGIQEINDLCLVNRVTVVSLCANYVMDHGIVREETGGESSLLGRLQWLIERCRAAGIGRVVLPFLDEARIETLEDRQWVLTLLHRLLPAAEVNGVELHLETSLPPLEFAAFLAKANSSRIKVAYDSGNSSSLGYNPEQEFAAYGTRIGSVHIKDRVRGGVSVPLGTGHAVFSAVFSGLSAIGYKGNFVLEAARGEPGGEVEWARKNRAFILERLQAVAKVNAGGIH